MDTSPHGIAVRDGESLIYANPAWNAMAESQTASEGEPHNAFVTSSSTVDYQGTQLTLTLRRDVSERRKTERQLIEAQKLEALGRWVGGVVHDFNNLLTAVMLYSDLIDHSSEHGSAIARYNDEIRAVAKRGAGLTGQLLAFLQQRPYERAIFSVNSLLKGLRELLERLMGEDVAVALELASGPCYVSIDPCQLQQVLFNIALNARDAMPSGGTLMIRTSETTVDFQRGVEDAVRLEIVDTGCGMDSSTCSRIFEPFFTTKPAGEGTGLGLTIVQKIATDVGGIVRVESEVGLGTTVTLDLPRAEPMVAQQTSEPPSGKLLGGTETLLIVEDESASRLSMAALLIQAGYKVLQASNGQEALKIAQEYGSEIHLLVTDIVLPGFSGRDLARRLSSLRPETRVLFISGYAIPETSETELIFHKPFSGEALALRVRQSLAGAASDKSDSVGR